MEQHARYIGFDVSAETIVIAEARPGRDHARDLGTIPYRPEAVAQWVHRQQPDAATLLICYEAGPTGFGLARHLHALGVACEVIAPGLIRQKATDRVKTDRRDGRKLAEDLRAGSLTPVQLPSADEEAFRDLVRARASAVEDRRRSRQRMKSALLRWDIHRPEGLLAWCSHYRQWIRTLNPAPAPRSTVGRVAGAIGGTRHTDCATGYRDSTGHAGPSALSLHAGLSNVARSGLDYCRHARGGSRRFEPISPALHGHGLYRPGSEGVLQWQNPSARPDHQNGQCPSPARVGRVGP